jgi:hypothetical protein
MKLLIAATNQVFHPIYHYSFTIQKMSRSDMFLASKLRMKPPLRMVFQD